MRCRLNFIAFDLKYFEKKGIRTHHIFVKRVLFQQLSLFVASKSLKSK